MERMRFTCSDKIEMSNLATWIVLANYHLDLQAKGTPLRSIGSPLPSKGRGDGEGSGRDLLRQTPPVAPKPLTSRLRSATARQAVLSPFLRGEATEHASEIKSEMHLTK